MINVTNENIIKSDTNKNYLTNTAWKAPITENTKKLSTKMISKSNRRKVLIVWLLYFLSNLTLKL